MSYIVIRYDKFLNYEILRMFKSFVTAQHYAITEINSLYNSYITSRDNMMTPFGIPLVEYHCEGIIYCVILYST